MQKKTINLKILGGVVLVLILLWLLFFHSHRHVNNIKNSTPPKPVSAAANQTYQYKQLELYKLGGGGSGIAFDKPVEFTDFGSVAPNSTQALLAHLPKTRVVPDYGQIAVLFSAYQPTGQYPVGLNSELTDKQSPSYKAVTEGYTGFINPRLPLNYKVTDFKEFKAFTNGAIKTNAWASEFSAQSSDKTLPKLEGEFVIAFGANKQYFFMVENVSSTWQANQTVWQQVLNSIKIDQ